MFRNSLLQIPTTYINTILSLMYIKNELLSLGHFFASQNFGLARSGDKAVWQPMTADHKCLILQLPSYNLTP